jgi:hypothetical protein
MEQWRSRDLVVAVSPPLSDIGILDQHVNFTAHFGELRSELRDGARTGEAGRDGAGQGIETGEG